MNKLPGKFTGMDLLKVAFPEPESRVPRIPEGSNGVRPLDDEFWFIPVSDEEVEPSEWIDEKVSEEGIDLLLGITHTAITGIRTGAYTLTNGR